jgi:hypothetical protein
VESTSLSPSHVLARCVQCHKPNDKQQCPICYTGLNTCSRESPHVERSEEDRHFRGQRYRGVPVFLFPEDATHLFGFLFSRDFRASSDRVVAVWPECRQVRPLPLHSLRRMLKSCSDAVHFD